MARASRVYECQRVRFNLEVQNIEKDTSSYLEGEVKLNPEKPASGFEVNGKEKSKDLHTDFKDSKNGEMEVPTKTLTLNETEIVQFEGEQESRGPFSIERTHQSVDYDNHDSEEITGLNEVPLNDESDKEDLKYSYQTACRKYGVTPASIFLRQCNSAVVDLKHYGLGDKGARAIAMAMRNNQTLECLNLHDNGIRETGIKSICEMLVCNRSLTKLDLSGNQVGKTGITALGEMLQLNVYLKDLSISACGIQGNGAEHLISSLDVNDQLESLNLSYNEIGDNGAVRLGSVLRRNQSLKCLDISWNNIRFLGAEGLCTGLGKNAALMELDLSWNGVGNHGSKCIKQALIENKSLESLNLCNNHISMIGIKCIAQGLQRNSTLQVLKIGKNPFLSSGASAILKSLLANQQSALRKLVLEDVVFNEECEDNLTALLEQNPMFLCIWDVSIKGGSVISGRQPEPMALLLTCINNEGFRLIDFYRILMNDYRGLLLKKEEFIVGIKKRNFPFSDKQLRALFDVLDTKQSGSITFDQFIAVKNSRKQKGKSGLR